MHLYYSILNFTYLLSTWCSSNRLLCEKGHYLKAYISVYFLNFCFFEFANGDTISSDVCVIPADDRPLGGGKLKTKSALSPNASLKDDKLCRVCGDRALGCNFDAISCESCKAFFRRNALKEKVSLKVYFYFIITKCDVTKSCLNELEWVAGVLMALHIQRQECLWVEL